MNGEAPESHATQQCLACGRTQDQVPLLSMRFRGSKHWICPQHLPLLIHDPVRLAGKLEGAERLEPADHRD